MSNFVTQWHFFKNTYGKPYIVRILFEVRVPAFCSLVADNMCRCDHWFSKEGNINIKYDIVEDGNISRPADEIIEKSIVVDLNAPYSELSRIELVVAFGTEKRDVFSELIVDIPNDPLVENSKAGF